LHTCFERRFLKINAVVLTCYSATESWMAAIGSTYGLEKWVSYNKTN